MIGAWRSMRPNPYLVPEAFTIKGAEAGELRLPDRPYWLSVAPDCASVAWVPLQSVYSAVLTMPAAQPIVRFTDHSGGTRTVRFPGICANQVAVSSKAKHLAVISVFDAAAQRRVIVLNAASGQVEYEVTDLIKQFHLSEVHRFQISSNGDRLCVASREAFVVIDLPFRRVLLQGQERSPSLCPSGDVLGVIDQRGELTLITLPAGARKTVSNQWWAIVGLGGWTPDGRFLLAGVRDALGLSTHLVSIDCYTKQWAEIMPLDIEGDHGETCVWVKRHFLSNRRSV